VKLNGATVFKLVAFEQVERLLQEGPTIALGTARAQQQQTQPAPQHLKHDWIELQLAHAQKDKIRAAYNILTPRSYFDERRAMVQSYADYLEFYMLSPQSYTVIQ